MILETFVNISRNNLKEWLRTEARTLNGLDLMIDSSKKNTFLFINMNFCKSSKFNSTRFVKQ
jgi:hypothetical protein